MQGQWVDVDEPGTVLTIDGGEVVFRGVPVRYDRKEVVEEDGAVTVELKVDDPALEDAFQRENITGLVVTPEGEFHAYNVKFASHFVRPAA